MSKFINLWEIRHQSHSYISWLQNWPLRNIKEQEIEAALVASGIVDDIDVASVFEIGVGACTNLMLAKRLMPKVTLAGNDLVPEKIIRHIGKEWENKIDVMGIDTATLFATQTFHPDLFMTIDHAMHLDTETVANAMEKLDKEWKPKYILIREANMTVTQSDENSNLPRLGHVYSLPSYDMIYDAKSACLPRKTMQDGFFYFIRVYKRR